MAADELVCDLPHGVRLGVVNTSGGLTVSDVAGVLAEVLSHVKYQRDVLGMDLYTAGSFRRRVSRRHRTIGIVRLWVEGGTILSTDLWTAAVAVGYSEANTLEQIVRDRRAYSAQARKEGGWLLSVMTMLRERGGDLRALRAELDRSMARRE